MEPTPLWPILVYFGAVLTVVAGMLGVSYVLGQRHSERATGEPYESGIVPTRNARLRLSVKYYIVAMLFVIFDLEAIFLFAWAVSARQAGWTGYLGMLFFLGILVAALVYEWRMGALDWGTVSVQDQLRRQQRRPSTTESTNQQRTN